MVNIFIAENKSKARPHMRPTAFNTSAVLVQFEDTDKHYDHTNKNYIPKHKEVLEIIKHLFILEDKRYPKQDGFKGRDMLKNEIDKIYGEVVK